MSGPQPEDARDDLGGVEPQGLKFRVEGLGFEV